MKSLTITSLNNELSTDNLAIVDSLIHRYNLAKKSFGFIKSQIVKMKSTSDDINSYLIPFGYNTPLNNLKINLWDKLITLSGVKDFMPSQRVKELDQFIIDRTPDFDKETVTRFLKDLLMDRKKFLAEVLDKAFKDLSGNHVTNSPCGFNQKMIFDLTSNNDALDSIHSLRYVISKFLNRKDVKLSVKLPLHLDTNGKWQSIDGGAIEIRAYKVGTVHLRVHEDLAWRLNEILAALYPLAIPAKHRKPNTKVHKVDLNFNFLSMKVIDELRGITSAYPKGTKIGYQVQHPYLVEANFFIQDSKKYISDVTRQLINEIGGTYIANVGKGFCGGWEFEYDPIKTIRTICRVGVMPERVTHQAFYTPDALSDEAVELANINAHHDVLEPSAGRASIAKKIFNKNSSVIAVELNDVNASICEGYGIKTHCDDFLVFAGKTSHRFDRIISNPPFFNNLAFTHIMAAYGLLRDAGRLVCIIPESIANKLSNHMNTQIIKLISGAFDNTNVTVALVLITK